MFKVGEIVRVFMEGLTSPIVAIIVTKFSKKKGGFFDYEIRFVTLESDCATVHHESCLVFEKELEGVK